MLRLPTFTAAFPTRVEDALELMTRYGPSSAYVAGGTDLYPNMKRRQQTPAFVIDVRRIPELGELELTSSGGLRIGAGVTLSRLIRSPLVGERWPVLATAAASISTPILQNMGTVGGNLLLDTRCNYYDQNYEWRKAIDFCMKKDGAICWVAPSSPRCWAVQSSDLAPVMIALGALIRLRGPDGERLISASELYRDDGIQFLTKLPEELLVSVEVPSLEGARASYVKLRRRGSFDFPVLGIATWARFSADRSVEDARIVLGAVGSYPKVSEEAAAMIRGQVLNEETIEAASRAASRPAKPLDNTDFTIGWRKDMVSVFVRRALALLQ
jgi:4-hydroxybenzoyl-CoA reductase subunit beta